MVKPKPDKKKKARKITVIYKPNELPYEEKYWEEWDSPNDGFRKKRSMYKSWKHKTKKKKQFS